MQYFELTVSLTLCHLYGSIPHELVSTALSGHCVPEGNPRSDTGLLQQLQSEIHLWGNHIFIAMLREKHVVMLELTVPWEYWMEAAH